MISFGKLRCPAVVCMPMNITNLSTVMFELFMKLHLELVGNVRRAGCMVPEMLSEFCLFCRRFIFRGRHNIRGKVTDRRTTHVIMR